MKIGNDGTLSSPFGVPDGQSDLFNRRNDNPIDPGNSVFEHLFDPNTEIEGTGGGGVIWARVNAAGTKLFGSGVGTTTRDSVGEYTVPLSTPITSNNYAVVVTPSAVSGNGGDGVVTFQEYDSHLVEDVANVSGTAFDLYNPTDGKTYQLDTVSDTVIIHDLANFATDPAGVSMGGEALSGMGVLDYEGRLLWMGENAVGDSKHLIAYDTTNGTVYDFGNIGATFGWPWSILAAKYNGGSPQVWIDILGSDGLKRYSPNLGTETLGSADHSYTGFNHEATQPATWDDSGTYWYASQSGHLYQVQAASTGIAEHTYPTELFGATPGGTSMIMQWDPLRKCLYAPLQSALPGGHGCVAKYTPGAVLLNDSGTWEILLQFPQTDPPGISYEQSSGVLMVSANTHVHRYLLDSMQLIDTVDLSALTSPTTGIPQPEAHLCLYQHPYAYIYTTVAGDDKHTRLSYQGDEITTSGGDFLVGSALIAQYLVVDSDTIKVYLYRSMSPMVRADGEFSIHVASGEAPGTGSGTVSSVTVTMPGEFTVSGSPVTTAGTVAVTWDTQPANTFLAGPTSGGDATPTYRALTAADFPAGVGTDSNGQCRLARSSSTQVKLSRFNGPGYLLINGAFEQVPSAGVTATISSCYVDGVAAQSLSDDTTYYVYAFMNSGTMTLDFSTTSYSDSDGVNIKTGVATRTLVGMIRPTGGAVVDTTLDRFVRSWYNDPGIHGVVSAASPNPLDNSGTIQEWNSDSKLEFLLWTNEPISADASATVNSGTLSAGATFDLYVMYDYGSGAIPTSAVASRSGWDVPFTSGTITLTANPTICTTLSQGYHYINMGYVFSGTTDGNGGNALLRYQTVRRI